MSDSPTPALVSAEWARDHLDDPAVRFVDVEWDRTAYDEGHIPGAVCWTWEPDLVDPVRRDLVGAEALADLLSRSGVEADTHVVLYGDDDWYASWAYWQLQSHGLARLSLLDGGRRFWRAQGLPYESSATNVEPAGVAELDSDARTRMRYRELLRRLDDPGLTILDVRTPAEYAGTVMAPEGYPAIAQRAGRVPGAVRAPWEDALAEDGRFRPIDELRARYADLGVDGQDEVTMYCGVGVRSSHTWFVLHELLGYEGARNYDGSWAEWGSVIGSPIQIGEGTVEPA